MISLNKAGSPGPIHLLDRLLGLIVDYWFGCSSGGSISMISWCMTIFERAINVVLNLV